MKKDTVQQILGGIVRSIVTFVAAVLFITSSFANPNSYWVKLNDPTEFKCDYGSNFIWISYGPKTIFQHRVRSHALFRQCSAIHAMAKENNSPLYFKVDNNGEVNNISEILQVEGGLFVRNNPEFVKESLGPDIE